jgi:asparagine synthase (glutamine-hydrolysing)
LFYTVCRDTLVFASEIKALFKFPGITPKIDREGLCEVFGLGPARTPGCGVYKNIMEIKPKELLVWSRLNKS